jgi:cob(I)alamin adenosyltransferase
MSIVTKKGDQGFTTLMYNRRVSKTDPRVEAYGTVDELNALLGLARATGHPALAARLLVIQKDLVVLMGELATAPEDLPRYVKDGYKLVTPDLTHRLDALVADVEPQCGAAHDWAMPGSTLNSAALDTARTVTRRAERRACELQEAGALHNPEIIVYLNRLSDALWLLARYVEHAAKNVQ